MAASNLLASTTNAFSRILATIFRVLADFNIECVLRSLMKSLYNSSVAVFGATSALTLAIVSFASVVQMIGSFIQKILDMLADTMEDLADTAIKHREYKLTGKIDPITVVGDEDDDGLADDDDDEEYPFSIVLSRPGGCASNPINIPTRANHQTTGCFYVYVHYESRDPTTNAVYTKYETHTYSFNDKGTPDAADDVFSEKQKLDQLGECGSAMLELVEFCGDAAGCTKNASSICNPTRTLQGTELSVALEGCTNAKTIKLTFSGILSGLKPEGYVERIRVAVRADMKYISTGTHCTVSCSA